jgi:hypothetical protein
MRNYWIFFLLRALILNTTRILYFVDGLFHQYLDTDFVGKTFNDEITDGYC